MNVIGIASQMQMGKDTIANHLIDYFPDWQRASLATAVKDIYCNAFDVDLDFVEEWKVKPEVPPGFLKNVRQSLQFIGDGFREIKSTVWMDLAFKGDKKIFSDIRYINELVKVRSMGGVNVLVWRPGFENDDPNGSEAQIRPILDYYSSLDGFEGPTKDLDFSAEGLSAEVLLIDYFIRNDGSLEKLYAKIFHQLVPYLKERFGEE